MNTKQLIATLAIAGIAAATQANTIDFSTYGDNVDLGVNTATFNQGGTSVTVYGFGPSGAVNLFSKQEGLGGENGLGLVNDPANQHEITPGSFIQIAMPTSPASLINLVFGDSITLDETALVYWSSTLGSLGSTLIGTMTAASSHTVAVGPAYSSSGYISITAGTGNVLLEQLDYTPAEPLPDGGATMLLLGGALSAAGMIRRKLIA